jgi:hypothetical protein
MPLSARRSFLVASLAAALLAGCGSAPVGTSRSGPPIAAPTLNVGDRWVYRGVDGFRVKIEWEETHEIAAIDTSGITVKVTLKGANIDIERTEKWSAPGVVLQGAVYDAETRNFEPPLIRYRFPLAPGDSWSQRIRDTLQPPGPFGPIQRQVRVHGYETVTTPAGTFDALRLTVIMTLDDETFWRFPTQCEYTLWYAESVGAMVQERKRSSFRDKGGQDAAAYHPGQNAEIELVSFTRP